MEGFWELLQALGIAPPKEEWLDLNSSASDAETLVEDTCTNPCTKLEPYSYDDEGNPTFLDTQMDYCDPAQYGFDDFRVIEDPQPIQALNWEDEKNLKKKRVHHYNRKDRFLDFVLRWFSFRVKATPETIELCRNSLRLPYQVMNSPRAFDTIRHILKINGYDTKDYPDIPYIIGQLGGPKLKINDKILIPVLANFINLSYSFNNDKHGRKRFPLYQHCLLELLAEQGYKPPYFIPGARTKIRREKLKVLYLKIKA